MARVKDDLLAGGFSDRLETQRNNTADELLIEIDHAIGLRMDREPIVVIRQRVWVSRRMHDDGYLATLGRPGTQMK